MDVPHQNFVEILTIDSTTATSSPLPRSMIERGAPFAFIGRVSNVLFGTSEEDHSDHLNAIVNDMSSINQQMAKLAGWSDLKCLNMGKADWLGWGRNDDWLKNTRKL